MATWEKFSSWSEKPVTLTFTTSRSLLEPNFHLIYLFISRSKTPNIPIISSNAGGSPKIIAAIFL